MKDFVLRNDVPKCNKCPGVIKPDVVLFGENLPSGFWKNLVDFPKCDLLIIIGTSLVVQPFASLIDKPRGETPRILINREIVGETHPDLRRMGYRRGFDFSNDVDSNDIALLGDCDDMIVDLCSKLGWSSDLQDLMKQA